MRLLRATTLLMCRTLLGLALTLAGLGKLSRPEALTLVGRFLRSVDAGLASIVTPLLPLLPGLELIAGILLLWGLATRLNASISGLLLVGFLVTLTAAWMQDITLDGCGCFGVDSGVASYPLIVSRDLLLLGLAGIMLLRGAGPISLDGMLAKQGLSARPRRWLALSTGLPIASVILLALAGSSLAAKPSAEYSPVSRIRGLTLDSGGHSIEGCLLLDPDGRILGVSGEGGHFDLRPGRTMQRLLGRSPDGAIASIALPQVRSRTGGPTGYSVTLRFAATKDH